jgi:hypothetical protein
MSMDRIRHDVAFAASLHILELFAPLLREEEKQDAFDEAFAIIKAALESYELQTTRMQQRLKPLSN